MGVGRRSTKNLGARLMPSKACRNLGGFSSLGPHHDFSKERAVTTRVLTLAAGLTFLAMPLVAQAQGVVRGTQEGAAVGGSAGNRAAGPVGSVVGAAVGGVAGGVAGGVNGALGIQPAAYHHRHHYRHYRGHGHGSTMAPSGGSGSAAPAVHYPRKNPTAPQ